eukprot:gb/GFBE01029428.1/.p1 GENE.gb/GFBE01029428.1/~~gb/GFBE01029428.1/.p1  ORF type:complete len:180 (+),score=27.54 gb/GFBE01029428.1/:1-540(+)
MPFSNVAMSAMFALHVFLAGVATGSSGTALAAAQNFEGSAPTAKVHYGAPRELGGACSDDEEEVKVFFSGEVNASVCAPVVAAPGGNPKCHLGGVAPDPDNGCPQDFPKPSGGSSAKRPWPICLSLPRPGKDYHCFLTCYLQQPNPDDSCPPGARCAPGAYLGPLGLCTYPWSSDSLVV